MEKIDIDIHYTNHGDPKSNPIDINDNTILKAIKTIKTIKTIKLKR